VLGNRGCDGGGRGGKDGGFSGGDHGTVFLVFKQEGPDGVDAWRGDEPLPGLVGGVAALQEHLRGVDAADAPHAREPLDLAALAEGEAGRVGLDLVDGRGEHARALVVVDVFEAARAEVGVELRHADGAPDAPGVVGAAGVERRGHLLDEPPPAHLVDAAGDEVVQHGELRVHPEEAALEALPERAAVALHELLDVRVGPSRYDGDASPHRDPGRGARGLAAEVRGRELGVRVRDAKKVVRHPRALVGRHLVGGHVQAGVQLHFVGVDDLAAEAQGEVDGEARLAGPRGAQHHDGLALRRDALPAHDRERRRRHRDRGVRERDDRGRRRHPQPGEGGRCWSHRGGRHGQRHTRAELLPAGPCDHCAGCLRSWWPLAWLGACRSRGGPVFIGECRGGGGLVGMCS
jgi:hypothetical protein